MTQVDNKLDLPRWSRCDRGDKFLYIISAISFLTIMFTVIVYYNILPMTLYALGISIFIAGVIVLPIVHKLEGKK